MVGGVAVEIQNTKETDDDDDDDNDVCLITRKSKTGMCLLRCEQNWSACSVIITVRIQGKLQR